MCCIVTVIYRDEKPMLSFAEQEASGFSEILVKFYMTTRRQTPDDFILHSQSQSDLKSLTAYS